MEKPYSAFVATLSAFGVSLPARFNTLNMHLDPDFTHLTYGDQGERAKQLQTNLCPGDTIVFYAGLRDIPSSVRLVYAIIGLLVVEEFVFAADIPEQDRDVNAHSRRILAPGSKDLVVRGRPEVSGRLKRCLPIGEYRDGAYRVRQYLLDEWGGLSVKDGYLQRSARLPRFLNPSRFFAWLDKQNPIKIQANN